MQTPPNNAFNRANFMQFGRGNMDQQISKSDLLAKFGPKYQLFKKQLPAPAERESINKIMSQMKKHILHIESTKWMYENNNNILPSDNIAMTNL